MSGTTIGGSSDGGGPSSPKRYVPRRSNTDLEAVSEARRVMSVAYHAQSQQHTRSSPTKGTQEEEGGSGSGRGGGGAAAAASTSTLARSPPTSRERCDDDDSVDSLTRGEDDEYSDHLHGTPTPSPRSLPAGLTGPHLPTSSRAAATEKNSRARSSSSSSASERKAAIRKKGLIFGADEILQWEHETQRAIEMRALAAQQRDVAAEAEILLSDLRDEEGEHHSFLDADEEDSIGPSHVSNLQSKVRLHREKSTLLKMRRKSDSILQKIGIIEKAAPKNIAHYQVYAQQLIDNPLDQTTIESLWTFDRKKQFYHRINILDDLLAILAVLGIAAAGGVCQLTYLAFTTDPYDFANTGIIADSFRDSWFVMLLKAATSVISFTMFIILIARMFVLHRLSVLQNHEPQLSSPCPWLFPCSCGKGHQRFALLVDGGWRNMLKCRYFYCTGVAVRTMAEIIVCVPHVPPGVDFSFQMKLPIWGEEDINYDMHVNILSMIAVARIYVFLRPLRNRVGFRSPRAAYIGKINGVQADSVSFALKLLLKKAPWATIVIGTCCTVIITSTLMWFVEKYSPLGFDTFEQALWCTIVTMSTVGYGDIYPVSVPGRMIMTLGGIMGGTLTAGLVTTVFVDLAILTENERRVLHVLDNQAWYTKMRDSSACVIQSAWRYHLAASHASLIFVAKTGKRLPRPDGTAPPLEKVQWAKQQWPDTPRTNRVKALEKLSTIKNRALKHNKTHAELRMFRLITKAQGMRNRPPQYDFKMTNIEKRVTTLTDSQTSFEKDMHARHQDMMYEVLALRRDMRELMLRSGYSGTTVNSVSGKLKTKLRRLAAKARASAVETARLGVVPKTPGSSRLAGVVGRLMTPEQRSVQDSESRAQESKRLHETHQREADEYVEQQRHKQQQLRKKNRKRSTPGAVW